jgi:hypothetical protein
MRVRATSRIFTAIAMCAQCARNFREFFQRRRKKALTSHARPLQRARSSVMPNLNQHRSKLFPMRYCAEKGGIVDGD